MVPAGTVALLNCFIGQRFINNSADHVRSSQSVPPLAFIVMNDTAGGNATLFGGCAVSQLTLLTQDVCSISSDHLDYNLLRPILTRGLERSR
jgi:hypothetical protein